MKDSLQEAFRALAKNLRWWILAQKEHDLRQVDLILGIDNLRNVFVLAWESKKLWTSFCCVTWVSLPVLFICVVLVPNINRFYSIWQVYSLVVGRGPLLLTHP